MTRGESRGRENDLENQNKNEENQNNEINENEKNKNIENNEYENNVPSSSKNNLIVPRRSSRKKCPVNRYGNPVTNCIYVNYVSIDNPESYNEAINSNESELGGLCPPAHLASLAASTPPVYVKTSFLHNRQDRNTQENHC